MRVTILLAFLIAMQLIASEIVQEVKGVYTINSLAQPTAKEKEEAVKFAIIDAKAKAVEKIGSQITVTREISGSSDKKLNKSKRSVMSASSAVVKHYVKDVTWTSSKTVVVTISAHISEEKVDDVLKKSSKNLEEMNKIAQENEKILTELRNTQKELKENAEKVRYKKLSLQSAQEKEIALNEKTSELISKYDNFNKQLIVALEKDYVKKSLIKTKAAIKSNKTMVENILYSKIYKPYINNTNVSVSNVEFYELEDGRVKMYFDLTVSNSVGVDRKALRGEALTKAFKVGGGHIGQKIYYHMNVSNELKQYTKKYLDEHGVAVVLHIGDEDFYGDVLAYNYNTSNCCMMGDYYMSTRGAMKKKMQIITTRDVVEYTNGEFTIGPELVGNRLVGIGKMRSSYIEKSPMGRDMLLSIKQMEPAKY